MRAKIAHISDVHFERLDRDVSDRLTGALRRVSPNLLIFTGDLVDNFWKIKQAKEWLVQLCTGCQLDPQRQLVVIPGNHDYRLYGNFGFRPATGHCFRKHFAEWNRKRVILYREYGICIIRFDSNPIVFGFARGVVSRWQLRGIRAELESLPDEDRRFVGGATKIALVHHHPLPVPYEGQDTFLMLEKAQNLIQFLAEQRVDCILHGHKHRAPHSLLSLGTCIGSDRVVQVIGAGTAVAGGTDRESRGHNFNVITVEDTGLLFAQQYFAQPGEDFREQPHRAFVSQALEHIYQKHLSRKPKYDRVEWVCRLNQEGDAENEITYKGLRPIPGTPLPSVGPVVYSCDTGHLSGVQLDPAKTSVGVTLSPPVRQPRRVEFHIRFETQPTADNPIDYSIQSSDFNAVALDQARFQRKFPTRTGAAIETEDKELTELTEHLAIALVYPLGYDLNYPPRLEVLDADGNRHDWLSEVLQPCFQYSQPVRTAFLSVHKPPTGYQYRISWQLPRPAELPIATNPGHVNAVERFSKLMLEMAQSPSSTFKTDIGTVLYAFAKLLAERIGAVFETDTADSSQLEISLMAYDGRNVQEPPKLVVVAKTRDEASDFAAEIGDGNAGRAYSGNRFRTFDAELARTGTMYDSYVVRPGRLPHEFLYSIPLRHRGSPHLIFGVLNVGTYDRSHGRLLRGLNNDQGNAWILDQAEAYVLKRLLEISKIVV